ncbi:AraC family transcriptional regulator [Pedobacter yulinensis]|uniref:AraC family transcriptional regulator n=1 Tax=Pedobacter yulinensis TaxID=2126353 RepID=A0A2T3HME0_9SPHI|nr:AraC family transcriptional regulator [Pedobacter yulinensis]PST83622.1 AraC family transcriptional regulator [Pedobacter yulinensis]
MEDYQKKLVLALTAQGSRYGIDPARLLLGSGLDMRTLQQQQTLRLTAMQVEKAWQNAVTLTGDPLFGLHFGESMQLAALGVVGQLIQTSSTVLDALTNGAALVPLLSDLFTARLVSEGSLMQFELHTDETLASQYPHTCRQMGEYLMVFVLHELDGLLLARIEPAAVCFPYRVNGQAEYQRVFRGKILPKPGPFRIAFEKRLLEAPVLSANHEMQNYLLQQVSHLMLTGESKGVLQAKVYNYLLANSFLYALTLDAVAANFNMSVRTLQRKLREEGRTFAEIVEAVRKNLAMQYLQAAHHPVKDIASILGYNEPSAFLKAFKRWTGMTPAAYRKKGLATDG